MKVDGAPVRRHRSAFRTGSACLRLPSSARKIAQPAQHTCRALRPTGAKRSAPGYGQVTHESSASVPSSRRHGGNRSRTRATFRSVTLRSRPHHRHHAPGRTDFHRSPPARTKLSDRPRPPDRRATGPTPTMAHSHGPGQRQRFECHRPLRSAHAWLRIIRPPVHSRRCRRVRDAGGSAGCRWPRGRSRRCRRSSRALRPARPWTH